MQLKTGYPYPLIRAGLPCDYPKLEKDLQTEVVVLGGGISGALTAFHLARAGLETVVIDARTIGLGSTSASTSLLQYEIDIPLVRLIRQIGKQKAESAYRLCGDAIPELEKIAGIVGLQEFRNKRSLYYAAHRKETTWLQEEAKARKLAGFNVQWLNPGEVRSKFGFNSHGAIYSEPAADTNAYLFTHAIHQYNIGKGATVFDRTEAVSIRHHRDHVQLKMTNGATIRTRHLVYATGYEVTRLIKKRIVKLKTTFATISEPLTTGAPYWADDALIWNTADPYLYIRSTPDNRIMAGGRDVAALDRQSVFKLLPKRSRQLKDDFQKLFPRINFIPEFTWAGVFGSTKDGLPYIGKYKPYPNGYFALGFGGNGITFSQVAARIVTSLILGKKDHYVDIFSFDR